MTDLVFRWPARQFAAAHRGRTHLYEFGWRSPACNGELGACHGGARRFRVVSAPGQTDHRVPVPAGEQAGHPEPRAGRVGLGEGADRQHAAPAQRRQDGALGAEGAPTRLVVESGEQLPRADVVRPALHRDGALPRLRQHIDGVEYVAHLVQPTQALHGGHGDDDGRDLARLPHGDAAGHVPPQVGEHEIGA